MPPARANWNLQPAAAVERSRFFPSPRGTWSPEQVGFGCRFGVKLGVLWAVESGLPLILDGSKHFKYLKKLTGKGKATNVMHITWVDPGCINAFKFGTDLPNWHAEPRLSLRD